MSVIVTFGHLMFSNNSIPEWTTSCRVIESAFFSYREQLVAFMKELGSIFDEMGSVCVSRTRSADISGISSNFGEMMGEIPRLWELNEIVLRELVSLSTIAVFSIHNSYANNYFAGKSHSKSEVCVWVARNKQLYT